MRDSRNMVPPILRHKRYDQPSTFVPENLLREAHRQKDIPHGPVPGVCVLDPDGDIVRYLLATDRTTLNPYWACYHTQMYNFEQGGIEFGIVGCAVGSSFAVLVAEEMFASGCQLLISVTSAGQILPRHDPPYFILIEKALRDEGTSYHYLPPSDYAGIGRGLLSHLDDTFSTMPMSVHRGTAWTTDAPFRETSYAIEQARAAGIAAVEMEAAALYAFSQARQRPVICFAHVTNQMAQVEGDFEKGRDGGSHDALQLILVTAASLGYGSVSDPPQ